MLFGVLLAFTRRHGFQLIIVFFYHVLSVCMPPPCAGPWPITRSKIITIFNSTSTWALAFDVRQAQAHTSTLPPSCQPPSLAIVVCSSEFHRLILEIKQISHSLCSLREGLCCEILGFPYAFRDIPAHTESTLRKYVKSSIVRLLDPTGTCGIISVLRERVSSQHTE